MTISDFLTRFKRSPSRESSPTESCCAADQQRVEVECHGVTDRGRKRSENQDRFLIADLVRTIQIQNSNLDRQVQVSKSSHTWAKLLMVADGMGGHRAGERASELAVESVSDYVLNLMEWDYRIECGRTECFEEDLKSALEYSHARVREEGRVIECEKNMGTTLTVAYLIWPHLYVVHAGDSRCYLLRNGQLQQLTTDHSYAQQFADMGAISAGDVAGSAWSHRLWNVVGGSQDEFTAAVNRSTLVPGDRVLLCTDGLTRCVTDEAIQSLLSRDPSNLDACQRLLEMALDAGGPDNISIVLASVRAKEGQTGCAHSALQ